MYPFHKSKPHILPSARVRHFSRPLRGNPFITAEDLAQRCADDGDKIRMENNLLQYGEFGLAAEFRTRFMKDIPLEGEDA